MKAKKQHSTMRALILALISLCMTFVVGALTTVALFYAENKGNTAHIQAGNLSVGAWIIGHSGNQVCVDDTSPAYGKLVEFNYDAAYTAHPIDLSQDEQSVFNITNAVPGVTQTAKIHVKNQAAFDASYTFRVVDLMSGTKDSKGDYTPLTLASDIALSKQIQITIEGYTDASFSSNSKFGTATFWLSDCGIDLNKVSLNGVDPNADLYYKITATFAHGDSTNGFNNNDAMGGSVSFDITIQAKQDT